MCKTLYIDFTDNNSFNPEKYLISSKLHLNEKGSLNLVKFLKIMFEVFVNEV